MVSLLLGNGDGTFQLRRDSGAGEGVIGFVAGDFNGDRIPDLVVDNHPTLVSPTVSLLRGRGDGTFNEPTLVSVGGAPSSLAAADFDGDGNLDLAVTTDASFVAILRGNGNGTFQPHVDYASGFGPYRIIATDLNMDNKPDLVVSIVTSIPSNGAISVLLGVGDGSFLPHVEYGTGTFGQLVADTVSVFLSSVPDPPRSVASSSENAGGR